MSAIARIGVWASLSLLCAPLAHGAPAASPAPPALGAKWVVAPVAMKVTNFAVAGASCFAATPNGIYRTKDGATWRNIYNSMGDFQIVGRGPVLYVLDRTNGIIYVSSDEGSQFLREGEQLSQMSPVSIAAAEGVLYAATEASGVFKSDDSAASWEAIRDGLPQTAGKYEAPEAMEVIGTTLYAAVASKLYRYETTLSRWVLVRPGEALVGTTTALVLSSGGDLFRAQQLSTQQMTTNKKGLTFNPVHKGGKTMSIGALAAHDNLVAAATAPKRDDDEAVPAGPILLSPDDGATWPEAPRLPEGTSAVTGMTFFSDQLLVATPQAVYRLPGVSGLARAGRLFAAVARKDTEATAMIISVAGNDLRDGRGRTALHAAAAAGDVAICTYLLEAKIPLTAKDAEGRTPLHEAAEAGRIEVIKLFLGRGAEIGAVDNNGRTAVFGAAWVPDTKALQALLTAGGSALTVDKNGRTPLHEAAAGDRPEAMRILLGAGADVTARDKAGNTPLDEAARLAKSGAMQKAIEAAKKKGDVCPLVKHAFPLAMASGGGPTVTALAEACPEAVNMRLAGDLSPLMLAADEGNLEATKALLKKAGDVKQVDAKGRTPLMHAASSGEPTIIDALVTAKAPLDTRDVEGKTALDLAIAENEEPSAAMLRKKAAAKPAATAATEKP